MQKLPSVVLLLGFAVLIASIVIGWMVVPKVINSKISQQVRLVNGSETFQRWQNVQIPIYVKFHLFNVTNPDEVLKGSYPKFQQVGPFVYLQKRKKVDVVFNHENDTVSYRQIMSYIYQTNMSVGSLNDKLTMLNVPLLGMAHRAARADLLQRSLIVEYIQKEPAILTRTVDEMLFKGYHDEMMEKFSSFLGRKLLPNNTFGFYYGKNNTDQGVYEVYTGVEDGDKFGMIASWNNSTDMPWWEDDNCKRIEGTDGSIFPPFVNPDRKLEMFSADLCRTLRLLYEKQSSVKGIQTYRFTVDPEILEDPVFNRDNMCYCTQPGNKFENCPKTGAYQLNACRKETPLLVSLPHFLDGSDEYLNKTEGLRPDRNLHETFIELEPNTGLLVKAAKRIQINIELKAFRFNKQLRKLPAMLLPLLWVDESVEIPDAGVERLQGKLLRPKSMAQLGTWGGIFLGLFIIAAAALIYLIRARRKKYST